MTFSRAHSLPQAPGFLDRPGRVVGQIRSDLETHVAVASRRGRGDAARRPRPGCRGSPASVVASALTRVTRRAGRRPRQAHPEIARRGGAAASFPSTPGPATDPGAGRSRLGQTATSRRRGGPDTAACQGPFPGPGGAGGGASPAPRPRARRSCRESPAGGQVEAPGRSRRSSESWMCRRQIRSSSRRAQSANSRRGARSSASTSWGTSWSPSARQARAGFRKKSRRKPGSVSKRPSVRSTSS